MTNEKSLTSVDSQSPEFQAETKRLIEEATWGQGGPMSYVDEDGWIVRHWKDGTIEKVKDTKLCVEKNYLKILSTIIKTKKQK